MFHSLAWLTTMTMNVSEIITRKRMQSSQQSVCMASVTLQMASRACNMNNCLVTIALIALKKRSPFQQQRLRGSCLTASCLSSTISAGLVTKLYFLNNCVSFFRALAGSDIVAIANKMREEITIESKVKSPLQSKMILWSRFIWNG